MAEIKVTPSVLRSKADELQNGVRNLSQKMEELHEKEAQLSTMWHNSMKKQRQERQKLHNRDFLKKIFLMRKGK